jgi:SAM-dependent methyltransferase/glycosyltransferase involved in cell wall biosynthesis
MMESLREFYDRLAPQDELWKRRNAYYHDHAVRLCRQHVPVGARVLEMGCGTGHLLSALEPAYGVGLDLSPEMVRIGQELHPQLRLQVGDAADLQLDEQFDYVVCHNLLGNLEDVQGLLQRLRRVLTPGGKVIFVGYNHLWQYAIQVLERAHLKMPSRFTTWMPRQQLEQLLRLEDYAVTYTHGSLLVPQRWLGLGSLFNLLAEWLPPLRHLTLVQTTVARIEPETPLQPLTCTVLIPTRNERGNIEAAVERTPEMGPHTELLFVDGNSTDGTQDEIGRMIETYRGVRDIKLLVQVRDEDLDDASRAAMGRSQASGKMLPQGKGHAVRLGFSQAAGDVLMILDADLTVPPEDLPRFYEALAKGKTQFANGSRLVYPMEEEAMRLPNLIGNKLFSILFSWLLGRYVGDTLCGTKALGREDYRRLAAHREFFGDFDPFGDFDLLFGAAHLNLSIMDIPIRYRARVAGDSKIINSVHTPLLFRMCGVAFWKLKVAKWLGRR